VKSEAKSTTPRSTVDWPRPPASGVDHDCTGSEIIVVFDPDDAYDTLNFVLKLASRPAGRVVCHPPPRSSSSIWFAVDLLLALGKRFDAVRVEHATRRSWQLVVTWMLAERTRDLFVLRADWLAGDRWQELVNLAQRCKLRLWLVVHRPDLDLAHRRILAQLPHQRFDLQQFRDRWRLSDGQSQPPDSEVSPNEELSSDTAAADGLDKPAPTLRSFPEVPGDEFYLFLAACRRLMDGASYRRIDDVHQQSQHDTAMWLQTQLRPHQRPPPGPPIFRSNSDVNPLDPRQLLAWQRTRLSEVEPEPPQPPAVADVCAFLQRLTATSSCAAETLVRLRGAQAAFFLHGFLLSLQLDSGAHPGPADLRPTMDPSVADRLRGLSTARLTAAMTLALVTEMTSAQLCQLELADIAADAEAVRVDGCWFAIPAYARSLVRVQVLERSGPESGPADPLFIGRDRGRLDPLAMTWLLSTVANRTGVIHRQAADHILPVTATQRWLRRRGLNVCWLGPPYPWQTGSD
jgi:hypothetical protein